MKNKCNWSKILDRLYYWEKQDNKQQDAMDVYCKELAPNEYSPIIDKYCVTAFIDGLTDDASLEDWLSYILYEVPMLKGTADVSDEKKRKYDFKKRNDIIKFLENNY